MAIRWQRKPASFERHWSTKRFSLIISLVMSTHSSNSEVSRPRTRVLGALERKPQGDPVSGHSVRFIMSFRMRKPRVFDVTPCYPTAKRSFPRYEQCYLTFICSKLCSVGYFELRKVATAVRFDQSVVAGAAQDRPAAQQSALRRST